MKFLCVNAGYYNTKIKSMSGECIYESKIQVNDDASKYIIIDNVKYEIGEGKRDIGNKFDNDTHTYCTYYGIIKNSKHFDTVNLMLALPMNVYLNKGFRDEYKKKFENRTLSYVVDGEFKSVMVNSATVYMEGASAMLLYRQQFNDVVGLVDIGGNTVNCAIFKKGKILLDTITTLDLGMIKLERSLIDELNIQSGLNIQDYEIKSFLKSDEKVVEMIINKHIQSIYQRLLEKKWNLSHIPIIATGGGAEDLRQYLPKYFNKVYISENPVMDNVKGLWLAGQVIYR